MRTILAAALLILLTGCGEPEAESTETKDAPPKATEAGICSLLVGKVDEAGGFEPLDGIINYISTTPSGDKPTEEQYEILLDRVDDIAPRAEGEVGEQVTEFAKQAHAWIEPAGDFDGTAMQAAGYDLNERCWTYRAQ